MVRGMGGTLRARLNGREFRFEGEPVAAQAAARVRKLIACLH